MHKGKIEDWTKLLERVKIEGQKRLLTEEGIAFFEKSFNICLPSDYKQFCQVFGSGIIGGEWNIFFPDEELISYSNQFIKWFKERVNSFELISNPETNILEMLDNCLVFGNSPSCVQLVWDLRTQSVMNGDCDIYLIQSEIVEKHEESIYKVGKSFYEFALAVLLDKSAYEKLPQGAKDLFGWPLLPRSSFIPMKLPYVKPPAINNSSLIRRLFDVFR